MSNSDSNEPPNKDIQQWINPDLEARIVASVLGEASDFECAELDRLIAENSELAVFKRRIEAVHELLGNCFDGDGAEPVRIPANEGDAEWRLAPERREALLEVFSQVPVVDGGDGETEDGGNVAKEAVKRKRIRWSRWVGTLSAAAAAIAILGLSVVSFLSVDREYFAMESASEVSRRATADEFGSPNFGSALAQVELAEGREGIAATDGLKRKPGFVIEMANNQIEIANNQEARGRDQKLNYFAEPAQQILAEPASSMERDELALGEALVGRSHQDGFGLADGLSDAGVEQLPKALLKPTARPAITALPMQRQKELKEESVVNGTSMSSVVLEGESEAALGGESDDGALFAGREIVAKQRKLQVDLVEPSSTVDFEGFVDPGLAKMTRGGEDESSLQQSPGISGSVVAAGALLESETGDFDTGVSSDFLVTGVEQLSRGRYSVPETDDFDTGVGFAPPSTGVAQLSRERYSGQVRLDSEDAQFAGVEVKVVNRTEAEGELPMLRNSELSIVQRMERSPVDGIEDVLASASEKPVVDRDWAELAEVDAFVRIESQRNLVERSESEYGLERMREERNEKKAKAGKAVDAIAPMEEESKQFGLIEQQLDLKSTDSSRELSRKATTEFAPIITQEEQASEDAFSTFSLHVSDVAFKLAQAALAEGDWPNPEKVRVEEFVNAFDYGDPAPGVNQKVASRVEQCVHPFLQQRNLMRVALRTATVGRGGGQPLRLTILLDHSGSMQREDREASVQRAMEVLVSQLQSVDKVSLLGFARTPRLLADRISGEQGHKLLEAVAAAPSEGGTNLETALQLASEVAERQFAEGAVNRIVLMTDGAANLGNADPEGLAKRVEELRQKGIAFDACGVGANGLNDEVLEALTRKGDGRYYFLDSPEQADAGFASQLAGALRPAAKNVKVQIIFNSDRVGAYRLLGFEKHRLNKEDFRNDAVDAAEMAAEEAGVAVYQFEPKSDGRGDVGEVRVRFLDVATNQMIERNWIIPFESSAPSISEAAPSMQLAAAAALLGEYLRGGAQSSNVDLSVLSSLTPSLRSAFGKNVRVNQLNAMIQQARGAK